MEMELGLKITRTRDNDLTTSHLRIAKDRAGPLFFSTETQTMFILTAHLKGFRREGIKLDINEDGTQIAISGEKHVQEMVMVKWTMQNLGLEIQGFRKVFRIPDGVLLDRIKARFNHEETILSIFMPKLTEGLRGIRIEEVEEEQEVHAQEAIDKEEVEPEFKRGHEECDDPLREPSTLSSAVLEAEPEVVEDGQKPEPLEDQFEFTVVDQSSASPELLPLEELQHNEMANQIPELEMKQEPDSVEEDERCPLIEQDQVVHEPETRNGRPTEEYQRGESIRETLLEDETMEPDDKDLEDKAPEHCETSKHVEEVIEEQETREVEAWIPREDGIIEEQNLDDVTEEDEEASVAFSEGEEDDDDDDDEEEDVAGNGTERSSPRGEERPTGWGGFRFPPARFIMGPAFLGLLIALIIQLLKKHKGRSTRNTLI